MPQHPASADARADRPRKGSRKAVYVIPSLLTTANIFCGFFSVMEALAGAQFLSLGEIGLATEHFDRAAVNIGFAVLFDFLDGSVARLAGATSEFGIELDSIADVISFGIAPAVLAYAWGYGKTDGLHKIAWAASFIFVICGALRLARFNVQARQPKSNLPIKNPKLRREPSSGCQFRRVHA
jgi:CDP-diacylglycerol--serine O-phosphatidyltransferase